MKRSFHVSRLLSYAPRQAEVLLRLVAEVLLPLLLALASIYALLFWERDIPAFSGHDLSFRVVQTDKELSPEAAYALLKTQPESSRFDTKLNEEPVWALVTPVLASKESGQFIDLPSRHLVQLRCFETHDFSLMGMARQGASSGQIQRSNAGFSVDLQNVGPGNSVLCESSFVGPASLSMRQMSTQELYASHANFSRNSGLLDGGLLVLAMFVFLTAAIVRDARFVMFGVWLIVNLRMGALSFGWDSQWLGQHIAETILPRSRLITTSIYYVVGVAFFGSLFENERKVVGLEPWFRVSQLAGLLLLVLSCFLSYGSYLPILWACALYTIAIISVMLYRMIVVQRSMVVFWYIGSIAVTLLSGFSEVISAALGAKVLIGSANSVTAALVSSLLASLAIAEQLRQAQQSDAAARQTLKRAFDAVPIGMFTLDMQGHFVSMNPALQRMLGSRSQRGSHHTWQQFFGAGLWRDLLDMVQNHSDGEIEIRSQMDVTGNQGPRRYLVKAVVSGDSIEGSLQDVTEKSIAAEELHFLADNDALTKVLNRRGIEKAFYESISQTDEQHPLALAYLDLDRFKLINDLFGHNAGDEVLRQVCQRVSSLLAPQMKLGRVGGDEFVILLPDTRMPLATVIARALIEHIEDKPFRVGDKAFNVLGSIGLIEVAPGAQFKEVLSTADRACREAKSGQQGRLVAYEQGSPAFREHQAELQLIQELSDKADIPGLFLEMQPIMSLTRPGEGLNFEVLLRMRDSAGTLVPVSRVIAAAENSGRMSAIDRWVLSTTLTWLDQHQTRLGHTRFVCLNLSGASLNDEEFMQEVFRLLRHNSHVTRYLTIEITESIALHDLKNTRRFIDKVRGLGARVALDDFGAGYTSFSYLKELPADLLKIDGSFIVNMNQHPANISIVEAIVNLARNLGMKTIAEWAEDTATVQTLVEIGVDYVQGYAVARPMAPEMILAATSAASFIREPELALLVETLDRQNNPLAQLDLLGEGDKPPPVPKIH